MTLALSTNVIIYLLTLIRKLPTVGFDWWDRAPQSNVLPLDHWDRRDIWRIFDELIPIEKISDVAAAVDVCIAGNALNHATETWRAY